MQFAVAAALFAALATAAPADPVAPAAPADLVARDDSTYFKVFNFEAACASYSTKCKYSFDLYYPGGPGNEPLPGVHCEKTVDGDLGGKLPAVADGTCKDSGRTWTVVQNLDGSLTLTARSQVSVISYTTGAHTIGKLEIKGDQGGGIYNQYYIGYRNFDLNGVN